MKVLFWPAMTPPVPPFATFSISCRSVKLLLNTSERSTTRSSELIIAKRNPIIIDNPHILNQLPYTVAVIKETMRLFLAASSIRQGDPESSLTEDSHQYPTEDCTVWSLHQLIHREPLYWPQPGTFIPERSKSPWPFGSGSGLMVKMVHVLSTVRSYISPWTVLTGHVTGFPVESPRLVIEA